MKTTTVSFHGLRITSTVPLYQYDYGQMLLFDDLDLPEAYEVHFSNTDMRGESTKQLGDADGVIIPDMYFQTGEDIFAWIYLHDDVDDGETMYKVRIPIKKRARPTDAEPTPVQQDVIEQAIAALNAAVEDIDEKIDEAIEEAIDDTLTTTGKAADAKVTGDGLKGIAAAFNPQGQYFAGDYVLHDFKLYRRVADCTSVWGDGSWIAANWVEANLGTDINQRVRIAASKYDHTRDYAVGEYCTHDRWMYRCISPVTGGSTGDIGNWDATKWAAVRIGEELTDLKEALSELGLSVVDGAINVSFIVNE